jgi:hypothetical protein
MQSRGGLIKLPPGAGTLKTNYGSGWGALLFFISKTYRICTEKKVMAASIHVRNTQVKKVPNFQGILYCTTVCDKKDIQRQQKCSCRSRSCNSDLRLRRAGAERNKYGSATVFFFSFSDFGKTGFVKALTTTRYFFVGVPSCFEI